MDLFLDDVRDSAIIFPFGAETARTFDEFIAKMSNKVDNVSLDHDLGMCDVRTGYDCLCWMEANNIWPNETLTIHSANPCGVARMVQVVNHSGKFERVWSRAFPYFVRI